MRSWLPPLLLLATVSGTVVAAGLLFVKPAPEMSLKAAEPPAWDAVGAVIDTRRDELNTESVVPFGTDTQINILALGLDSRKEGYERHCDSIHMITLDLSDWSVLITSVPRGTYSSLPPGGTYKVTDYYVANACSFGGLDYGIQQIERIVGVKADYVATVGFSQALGIFRALELPTTQTLQWLRHRQSYAIGDPQRSHNQAVFIKDMSLKLLTGDGVSSPLMHIMFSLVDTDLDFKTMQALYTAYRASDLEDRPEDIKISMRPYYQTVDYHYDPEQADVQVDTLVSSLRGRLSPEDLSFKTAAELQVELEAYLREALASGTDINHAYQEQLWRQLDNETTREEFHYEFMKVYVNELKETNHQAAVDLVTDYILEKQYYGLTSWEKQGRNLLSTLIEAKID